ncbi:hypothetical protein PFISCL1PPCAC_19189, partial [Pristionchus fissidentatus]
RMSEDTVEDLKMEMMNMEELTLMNLPDEILSMIITNLDIPSRLNFRVNRRLNRVELATKNRIEKLEVTIEDDSFLFVVNELEESKLLVEKRGVKNIEEGLERIAMNTTSNTITANVEDVNQEEFELIKLFTEIPTKIFNINPECDAHLRHSDVVSIIHIYPTFNQLDYHFLLSLSKKRKRIEIGIECDSLSVQEWVTIRQMMLSREISLVSLKVLMDENVASSILFALHGVKFEWRKTENGNRLKIYTNEEGKIIHYIASEVNFVIRLFNGRFVTTFYRFEDRRFNMLRFGLIVRWCKYNKEQLAAAIEKCHKKVLTPRITEMSPSKKRISSVDVIICDSSYEDGEFEYSLTVEEMSGIRSVDVRLDDLNELKKRLKRIAKFRISNKVSLYALDADIGPKEFEIFNLMLEIEADEMEIMPDYELFPDYDDIYQFPSFPQLEYDLLLSICENRKRVSIDFDCISVPVEKWIELRRKIFSHEIPLTFISVILDKSTFNSLLLEVHGIRYERKRYNRRPAYLRFISPEERKTVTYREDSSNGSFSILLSDGLFVTEFYAFKDIWAEKRMRFGLRMRWIENEEEVVRAMQNYRTIYTVEE